MGLPTKVCVEYWPCYGEALFKPACEISRLFCELLGQKTLTRANLRTIERMGFEIEIKPVTI